MPLSYESMPVYIKSVEFIAWSTREFARVKKTNSTLRKLERTSGTIPIYIALGYNQSFSYRRNKYYQTALHAGVESAGLLDILKARQVISDTELQEGKNILSEMLTLLKEYIGEDEKEDNVKPENFYNPANRDLLA